VGGQLFRSQNVHFRFNNVAHRSLIGRAASTAQVTLALLLPSCFLFFFFFLVCRAQKARNICPWIVLLLPPVSNDSSVHILLTESAHNLH
jgi:hypothetical protein